MSKICPNCKREIDENVKFCPFCAAFTGETPQEKKKSPVGAIIGGAAGVLALGAASLAVFVFDIFGMYGEKNGNALRHGRQAVHTIGDARVH